MDFYTLLKRRADCITDAPSPCSFACPLGLDIRDFIRKMSSGLYSAAFKTFEKGAVMPGIVCHICGEPCRPACMRSQVDEAVSLRELEYFCWKESRNKAAKAYYIPAKEERILIVGGGISGMSCAIKLAQRGYQVELVEKSGRLGGRLWQMEDHLLPKQVLLEEIDRISHLPYLHVRTNTQIDRPDAKGFGAAFVATGDFAEGIFKGQAENGQEGVFYADASDDFSKEPLKSIYRGIQISHQIVEYVKVGKVTAAREQNVFAPFKPDMNKVLPCPKVPPQDPQNPTPEEMRAEARRCILCECSNCSDVCAMMQHYETKFKSLMMQIADTIETGQIVEKRGLYPIMSCVQCGSCKQSCPVDIDTKRLCLESRRLLHTKGQLPDSHYEYWLSDMLHANGEEAALCIPAEGEKGGEYVYFPGCQMGASSPEYVMQSFRWLRETFPGQTSLILSCCGAPARWSGNEQMHHEAAEKIRAQWLQWEKPVFILACPTCAEVFREHLPEIRTIFLWEMMADNMLQRQEKRGTVSVFDPCTCKADNRTRENIRRLIAKAGYAVAEIKTEENEALCCGYGGLIYSSNPELFHKIAKRNKDLSEFEMITYCTNCKDIFVLNQGAARHILDLVFEKEMRKTDEVADMTERRKNRTALKKQLMKEVLGVEFVEKKESYDEIQLMLSPEIKSKMDRNLILEDQVKQIIEYAKSGENQLYEAEKDLYTAHMQLGRLTYWVQYRPAGEGYFIHNVYFHRMRILEG